MRSSSALLPRGRRAPRCFRSSVERPSVLTRRRIAIYIYADSPLSAVMRCATTGSRSSFLTACRPTLRDRSRCARRGSLQVSAAPQQRGRAVGAV